MGAQVHRAVVKELPKAVPGKERETLEEMAKVIKKGLDSLLADLVVTPNHGNWTMTLETTTYLLTSDVMDELGSFFAGGPQPIRIEVPDAKLEIVCCR